MENRELLERLTGLVDTIRANGTAPQQQQVEQAETTEEALRTLYPSVRGRGGGTGIQSKSTNSNVVGPSVLQLVRPRALCTITS